MASAGSDWRTNPETQIKWGLQYIKERYGNPDHALQKWDARSPHWYGNGGIFDKGAQVIGVGERGPEAVIPLDSRGVAMLAKAFGQHLGAEDGRKLVASNGSHMTVNHHEQITYDQRNDFGDAKITVMSNDPDDMARKLEARKVRSRLTQTRGVNRR
jgi:SLT domain-containing protein